MGYSSRDSSRPSHKPTAWQATAARNDSNETIHRCRACSCDECLPFGLSRLTKQRRVVRPKTAGQQKGRHLPALPNKSSRFLYGFVGSGTEIPKMSLLPKVAGQSVCGAGLGTGAPPVRRNERQASIPVPGENPGQSAALRTSFQTAAPYVFVAAA